MFFTSSINPSISQVFSAFADVYVRATNTDGDALSIREALWYGCAVMASECVERPDGCLLYEARNVKDLVRVMTGIERTSGYSGLHKDFSAELIAAYRRLVF